MIDEIVDFFFRENKEKSDDKRSLYVIVCSVLGILLNLLLFVGKIIAGFLSGSVAIRSDAFNNLSDAASSVITYLGLKLSEKKPDPEHPFGHGRIEYLSGLAVSILILLMGFELCKDSFSKILDPRPLNDTYFFVTIVTLALAVAVKLFMWRYNKKYGTKVNSTSLLATGTDSLSDAIATLGVLVASFITKLTHFYQLDGICGTIVSLFILYAGINSIKETLMPLLGQPPEPEFIEKIQEITLSHKPIIGIHDLVVHDYGPGRVMISLHAEVPSDLAISQVHDVIDNAELDLKERLKCEAVIHCDPIDTKDPKTFALKEDVNAILHDISPEISMHDFRVVYGNTHTNLVFDLMIPHGFSISSTELCKKVRDAVITKHPKHFCVIQIDYDYNSIHHL